MQYRENKKGEQISALGFGCMRLPRLPQSKEVDIAEANRMFRTAYESGINYFDTAYVYDGGKNEVFVGGGIKEFRKNINLATKLPTYLAINPEAAARVFQKSLTRLGTDYIDYYLIHSVTDFAEIERLEASGVLNWLRRQNSDGKIRNLGFSFHGKRSDFIKIIDYCDWDFTQIQYNYWDINYQAGAEGLRYAKEKGVPVIVMEPLRGGAIVNRHPQQSRAIFEQAVPDRSLAEWGLRWVWDSEGVMTVLSGMSSMAQLEENLRIVETATVGSLSEEEHGVYDRSRAEILKLRNIPCTGCAYCMPCPNGVDIPGCFAEYNGDAVFKPRNKRIKYIAALGGLSMEPGFASQCVACGACERKCPQHIPIINSLKLVKKTYEFPGMVSAAKLIAKIRSKL